MNILIALHMNDNQLSHVNRPFLLTCNFFYIWKSVLHANVCYLYAKVNAVEVRVTNKCCSQSCPIISMLHHCVMWSPLLHQCVMWSLLLHHCVMWWLIEGNVQRNHMLRW